MNRIRMTVLEKTNKVLFCLVDWRGDDVPS